MRSSRGFTLIELMIVASIVAILAFFAVPSFRDHQRQSQATAGVAELALFRQKMETYYQDHRNFGPEPACGVPVPAGARFRYACTAFSSGQAFTLTATGVSGAVAGSVYRIDQTGLQVTTMFKGKSVTRHCWLLQGGECQEVAGMQGAVAAIPLDPADLRALPR